MKNTSVLMADSLTRKYSNIAYDEIRDNLITILKAKGGKLADFSVSSYGRTIIELFAGSADLMAFYAESSFNNAFLELAYNLPAIYAGARMLGYSIRRPVPAKTAFAIQTKKTGVYGQIKLFIPMGTQFSLSGKIITAIDDTEWVYDRNEDPNETGLLKLVSGKCVCAEGFFKSTIFASDGTQNQTFILPDRGFSDYFGDNDPNYSDEHTFDDRKQSFTTITTDASLVDNFDSTDAINGNIYWRVSRRGLIDPANDNKINDIDIFLDGENSTTNYTALVETTNDGLVQVKFGDGLKSAIPFGEIAIRYFYTNGEDGNLTNVSGMKITPYKANIQIRNEFENESDIKLDDLNFAITTDLRGGLNIEDAESIKRNSPAIYNTLDRLVNKLSYQIFLSRYSDVKYANAFGEDLLNAKLPDGTLDVKYMNMVRFTAIKDLYRLKEGKYYPTAPDEYFLSGFKVNGLMYVWQYDNQKMPDKNSAYKFRESVESLVTELSNSVAKKLGADPKLNADVVGSIRQEIVNNMGSKYEDILTLPYIDTVFGAKMTPYDFVETGSEIYCILRALNRRSMITLGSGYHMYVYPVVHNFKINMDLVLFRGNNFSDIKEKIKNSIYKYLKENTDFKTPLYRSKIESIVHSYPEVAGVNVTFEASNDMYDKLDLTTLTWLGDATNEYISSGTISRNNFDITLKYTHKAKGKDSYTESITFPVTGQSDMSGLISAYYKKYLATLNDDGSYSIRDGINEDDVDKYVAYIWDLLMQSMFKPVYEEYKRIRSKGDIEQANRYYDVIDAIKGWTIKSDNKLGFVDNDTIQMMEEVNGNYMYDYIRYGLEYVKLVRNILLYKVAKSLIDTEGNLTNYSMDNEIVQCEILPENINISYERDI